MMTGRLGLSPPPRPSSKKVPCLGCTASAYVPPSSAWDLGPPQLLLTTGSTRINVCVWVFGRVVCCLFPASLFVWCQQRRFSRSCRTNPALLLSVEERPDRSGGVQAQNSDGRAGSTSLPERSEPVPLEDKVELSCKLLTVRRCPSAWPRAGRTLLLVVCIVAVRWHKPRDIGR